MARVVYCQPASSSGYYVGLHFRSFCEVGEAPSK